MNKPVHVVSIEGTLIDDLKALHGIDAIAEIQSSILNDQGILPEINITYNGDFNEDQGTKG